MDYYGVLEVISYYRKYLKDNNVGKMNFPHNLYVGLRLQILAHCNGMLDKMDGFILANKMDKTFRWLGFIQGCLWATGCFTLEQLRNHNRPKEDR